MFSSMPYAGEKVLLLVVDDTAHREETNRSHDSSARSAVDITHSQRDWLPYEMRAR